MSLFLIIKIQYLATKQESRIRISNIPDNTPWNTTGSYHTSRISLHPIQATVLQSLLANLALPHPDPNRILEFQFIEVCRHDT